MEVNEFSRHMNLRRKGEGEQVNTGFYSGLSYSYP